MIILLLLNFLHFLLLLKFGNFLHVLGHEILAWVDGLRLLLFLLGAHKLGILKLLDVIHMLVYVSLLGHLLSFFSRSRNQRFSNLCLLYFLGFGDLDFKVLINWRFLKVFD